MKIGLALNTEYATGDDPSRRVAEHLEQVRAARDAGFDLIGVVHHYSRGPSYWFPPLLMAAAVAAEAGPLRVASTVFLLPLAHPVEVAEQVAMLDALTRGRFIFGVGLGWRKEEFEALEIDMAHRAGRLEEALALMERLWRGESVTFEGRHFHLNGVSLTLRPARRPPIWVAGNSAENAIRRAARVGDAWIISSHPSLEMIDRHLPVYRAELERLGKPWPEELPVLRNFYISTDLETALSEARDYFEESYKVFCEWGLFEDVLKVGKRHLSGGELLGGRLIIGGPEECLEQIEAYRQRIPGMLPILRMQWMGMPHAKVMAAIERVGSQILPALGGL